MTEVEVAAGGVIAVVDLHQAAQPPAWLIVADKAAEAVGFALDISAAAAWLVFAAAEHGACLPVCIKLGFGTGMDAVAVAAVAAVAGVAVAARGSAGDLTSANGLEPEAVELDVVGVGAGRAGGMV